MKDTIKMPPKLIIEVVYRSKDGTWRGFCAPFDISCTASNAEEAKKKIDELVNLYKEGLEKYNYPSNLTVKEVSDEEDKKVFDKVYKHVIQDIDRRLKDFKKFQRENQAVKFTLKDYMQVRGNYSFPSPSLSNC